MRTIAEDDLFSHMEKRWDIRDGPSQEMRDRFPELHPVVVQLLWNRGIMTQEDVDGFLTPDYGTDLHDPFLFRQMRAACSRVWRAIEDGEKVVIHGDYDADGVTGTAVLMTTFRAVAKELGKDPDLFTWYLPHREKEGYGIRTETVERLAADGYTLMITVDCGISCADEIARATELGLETIIVDHHQVPADVPECITLHPLVEGETYPYGSLAAVGVAFKFACGFITYAEGDGVELDPGFDKWLLDLVAIATVTDFVPLIGENRTLERYGLIVLNKTRRPGLRKLIEGARLTWGELDTISVGFYIGPRINAASRMDHADRAIEMLMAEDEVTAADTAKELDRLNGDRQRYTANIVTALRKEIVASGEKTVHIVAHEGWSAGIVGLVAGKMVTETGRPVFVFGKDGDTYVGSGRSIDCFDLVQAMDDSAEYLHRYGGHPQACGLTIVGEGNFTAFVDRLTKYADAQLAGKDLRPVLSIDAVLATSQITWELIDRLEEFEPHGVGNQKPRFMLRDVPITSLTPVGKNGKHVRIGVHGDAPKETTLIAFGMAELANTMGIGGRIDVVVELGVNRWNGTKTIQAKVVEFRAAVADVTETGGASREKEKVTGI